MPMFPKNIGIKCQLAGMLADGTGASTSAPTVSADVELSIR